MIPYLFHIYGPLYANCYGLAILIGILTLLWFAKRDNKLMKLVSYDQLINSIVLGTMIGIVGGALLWGFNNWHTLDSVVEIFEFWRGGFSILGTIIAVSLTIPLYLRFNGIPILPFLDRIAIYAPLVQSISRIGCFFAGCCHGSPTGSCIGITYTHPDSAAPLGIKVHPAQLYSSFLLCMIFIFMFFVAQKKAKNAGELMSMYLVLAGFERFVIDFWRGDKEYNASLSLWQLSSNQLIALGVCLSGVLLFIYYRWYKRSYESI